MNVRTFVAMCFVCLTAVQAWANPNSIKGTVWCAPRDVCGENTPPGPDRLAGCKVFLLFEGEVVKMTETDANGNYFFSVGDDPDDAFLNQQPVQVQIEDKPGLSLGTINCRNTRNRVLSVRLQTPQRIPVTAPCRGRAADHRRAAPAVIWSMLYRSIRRSDTSRV